MLTDVQQRKAAKQFIETWKSKGYEKGESQPFWLSLLRDVLGIESPEKYISFENRVQLEHTSFIDAYIASTRVLIEQKGSNKDLLQPIKQSDGSLLTPFQQAKRYISELSYSQHPRWVVTCNFREFLIYDMEKPQGDPVSILLNDLETEYYRLSFLINSGDIHIQKETEISIQAGELVGRLYDALLREYHDPQDERTLKSLNILCVRIVFCLYAEDAGLLGKRSQFHDYLTLYPVGEVRQAIINLFKILDTPLADRDPYLDDKLAAFPYIDGGLFAKEDIEIPRFNPEIVNLLLTDCSEKFDWSGISPTIFGGVFESTLNPETRRSGGMHYTSIENIHKVIDPLFLNDLKKELTNILDKKQIKVRANELRSFIDKLASLTFLDPACGSGNFLTETFLSLRRLENEALRVLEVGKGRSFGGQLTPVKISIYQFYGIEINDFAVAVARTALWIAEAQMNKETEDLVGQPLDFFPLHAYANITEANALRIDWESIVPKDKLNYIMGNPPFVGARLMSVEQKEEVNQVFGKEWKNVGNIDYVSCWYKKCVDFIQETNIYCALVSTNSITQGEQVANLWKPLLEAGIHIDFAYRTFRWDSEAKIKAHVHCVIVGFSHFANDQSPVIFDSEGNGSPVKNINPYLIEAPNTFIENRCTPICKVPEIGIGNKPIDNGNYLFEDDEKEEFLKLEPSAEPYFRRWYGADEFINNRPRWCLWLGDCSPHELRKMPHCMKRIEAVHKFRLASKSAGTVKLAERPTRFHVENMPKGNYIVIPETSSEKRIYVPIGFMNHKVLCSNALKLVPNATRYHFGVLTSNVHMAWMRVVCGRLEMRYRYSKEIVYNNFPWPNPTKEQKKLITQTAQGILDARALYPDCSLADLYDDLTMPPELRKAHTANDLAVRRAYGFGARLAESKIVAELMKQYQEITKDE